jgi:hypothetical protein
LIEEKRVLKFVHNISIPLLLIFMILASMGVALAETSRVGNGGSAQVHVRFKIVIAPYIAINTSALSTEGVNSRSNTSTNGPVMLPIGMTAPSSLGNPSGGRYIFAESPVSDQPDSLPNRRRNFILCSP